MKRILFIFLLTFLFSYQGISQQYWGKVTESEYVNEAMDIQTDGAGNSYVAGYITGETAFGTTVSFPSAQGNGDIYVAKYSSAGVLVWVKRFGGMFSDRAYNLALDNSGNILVTGQFSGTVNFDSHTITSTGNSKDIFLVKLDNLGNTIWALSEGGSGSENAYGVTCDNAGNVILTGQYAGSSILGGQSFSSIINPQTNQPSYDLFVSKYNSMGTVQWVKTGTGKYENRGLSVTTDAQNNVYISGQYSDTLLLAGQTFNNAAYNVGLVAKFSPLGNLMWLNNLRSNLVLPYDLMVDGNSLVVVGDCGKNLNYSNNGVAQSVTSTYSKVIFLLKTDLDGKKTWISTLGSENDLSARSLAINGNKDIYVTGYFSCAWTQFHQPQKALYSSVGFKDAYLWKATTTGALGFVKTFGSKLDDVGRGVAITAGNNPVICGGNTGNLNIPRDLLSIYTLPTNDYFSLKTNSSAGENMYFTYLEGDVSRNSFITNAVGSFTPDYNYFVTQPPDSLFSTILPNTDTVHFCSSDYISVDPKTFPNAGPAYDYLWSNGDTTKSTLITSTNDYSVKVTRNDGCSFGGDTTHVIIHTPPTLPVMTDNLGLAINEPGSEYYSYHFCYPDSVQIWFNGLAPNTTIKINSGSTVYQDTLPHFYKKPITYVTVSDQYCSTKGVFYIYFDYAKPYNYIPYLTLHDIVDHNDSISICKGSSVLVENHDSTNNPNGTLGIYPDDPYVSMEWSIFLNGNMVSHAINTGDSIYYHSFTPNQTGDYIFQLNALIGYNNLCGTDTTRYFTQDTFHIEVLPNPIAPHVYIQGDNLLCPNGSVYLYVDSAISAYSWSGPGIHWTAPTGDTVQVVLEGNYQYGGVITDSVSGCSSSYYATFLLNEKEPPLISQNPFDAIVCPYDSVYMWVDSTYISYDWTGPQGSGISTVYHHKDELLGFYYVTVLDGEGCYLTSPPMELKEYSTPYLTVEPTYVICDGESTTISVIKFGDGVIQWVNPAAAGSSTSITVNQPGWYVCQITQCGITVVDSVEILSGYFNVTITTSDSLLCNGDNAIISAPPGYFGYDWSTGESGVSTIVTSQAGHYSVTVYNEYGCSANSNEITIAVSGSLPPSINDIQICVPGMVTISHLDSIIWYTMDTSIIGAGFSTTVNVTSDTSLLISYPPTGDCPIKYDTVSIKIMDSIPLFHIFGDTSLCVNEDLLVYTDAENVSWEWSLNGIIYGNSDSISIPHTQFQNGDILRLKIYTDCQQYLLTKTILVHPTSAFTLEKDTIFICANIDTLITSNGNFNDVHWVMNGDTLNSQDINFNGNQSQYVYAWGIDTNGCSTSVDSILIEIPQESLSLFSNTGLSCSGDSVTLSFQSTLDSVIWMTPQGIKTSDSLTFTLSAATSGWYIVEASDSLGCHYADSIKLISNNLPVVHFPNDTIICLDNFVGEGYINNNYTLVWNNAFNDSISIGGSNWYQITVTDNTSGCMIEDSVFITIVNCDDAIPNVFSPNGDGINDYFVIDEAIIYPNNYLIIFNRWGEIVYEQHGYKNSFGGNQLVDGVYFYRFYHDYKNHPKQIMNGFFHILR